MIYSTALYIFYHNEGKHYERIYSQNAPIVVKMPPFLNTVTTADKFFFIITSIHIFKFKK